MKTTFGILVAILSGLCVYCICSCVGVVYLMCSYSIKNRLFALNYALNNFMCQ